MSRSLIYTDNSTGNAVAVGVPIPVGNIIRKSGCAIKADTYSIRLSETGYYNVDVSAIITSAETGNVTLALYQDGKPVYGGLATENIATANTAIRTVDFHSVVRVFCCQGTSVLTVVPSGVTPTVIDITFRVEKV